MKRVSLASLMLCLSLLSPVRADDSLTTFHYRDLYNIQQGVSSLQDLRRLQIGLFVTSTLPAVTPDKIKMTIHRATGRDTAIPMDAVGRVTLPSTPDLMDENPMIVTNQPKHTLKASVVIDLVPLTKTDMDYVELMQGVEQFNQGIANNGVMAALHPTKANGLLLFYNAAGHSLTLREPSGSRTLKSESVDAAKAHLKGINTKQLIPSTTVIYVPWDAKLLKENPRVGLDALPADTTPAF